LDAGKVFSRKADSPSSPPQNDSNVCPESVQEAIDIVVEMLASSEGGSLHFHYKDITATIRTYRASAGAGL
jgi:hypothetical protein